MISEIIRSITLTKSQINFIDDILTLNGTSNKETAIKILNIRLSLKTISKAQYRNIINIITK